MNKWMLVVAVVCSVNINAMEQKNDSLKAVHRDIWFLNHRINNGSSDMCGPMILFSAVWGWKGDKKGWRDQSFPRQTWEAATGMRRALNSTPDQDTCKEVLTIFKKFAFTPERDRSCGNELYRQGVVLTLPHARTGDHKVLQFVLDDVFYTYFESICNGKK